MLFFMEQKTSLFADAMVLTHSWFPEGNLIPHKLSEKLRFRTKWIGCEHVKRTLKIVLRRLLRSWKRPFNEIVVMGVLAVRLQALNQELHWDGKNMKFTNIPNSAKIRTIIEDGFKITDGHPTFDKKWTEPVDANAYAEEMIKHTYQNGWKLPAMP